ncbi:hypothetical protein GYB62_03380, partial [bacterium]|nr:hypothetical protein [bacterium]
MFVPANAVGIDAAMGSTGSSSSICASGGSKVSDKVGDGLPRVTLLGASGDELADSSANQRRNANTDSKA